MPGRQQSTPDSKALGALRHQATTIPPNRPHLALGSYPPFIPSTSAPIQRGPPYQALEHQSASAFASSWPSVLGSAEQSAAPPPSSPVRSSEHDEQAESARTLRSVRTKYGDVYAEYELSTDQAGGRWVCQCGSTFVRDSDWERHAMHSLSHGVGGGFDCNICDISFTRSDAMSRHLRKKHGGLNAHTQGDGRSRRMTDHGHRFSKGQAHLSVCPSPLSNSELQTLGLLHRLYVYL
ncbi:hypothetical protein BJY52DRAFT_704840 [Lactarius psammicola]|nr:hypothetical protein BJY52DRAFT_704840 [Lactarius psammicola]